MVVLLLLLAAICMVVVLLLLAALSGLPPMFYHAVPIPIAHVVVQLMTLLLGWNQVGVTTIV
jgi:hypothetical protein